MRFQKVVLDTVEVEIPPDVVSTEQLEARLAPVYEKLGIPPGQLEHMTGVHERRYWKPETSLTEAAAMAARNALDSSQLDATDIDALVYGSVCREDFEPATASHVASRLADDGYMLPSHCVIHDVSNACLGFLTGMIDIANRIELGHIKAGMVVACESARDITDMMTADMLRQPTLEQFRYSIATLTGGSGAAAAILTDGSFACDRPHALHAYAHASAPQYSQLCRWGVTPPRERSSDWRAKATCRESMRTDPGAVLEHGVELGAHTWDRFLSATGWTAASIDRVIAHQVGSKHRDTILKRLHIPPERDFVAYDALGNTGTAAIPMAIHMAQRRGFLQAGQRVALLGIGSGLNCLMLGVEW